MHLISSLILTATLAAHITNSSPTPYNPSQSPIGTTVDLEYATYQGSANGLNVNQFLGIRYAAPPLGNLRFRAPQNPLNETSTIKADAVSLTHVTACAESDN